MCYDMIASQYVIIHRLCISSLGGLVYSSDFLPYWKCSKKNNRRDVYFFNWYPSLGSSICGSSLWVRSSPLADYIDPTSYFVKQAAPWGTGLEFRLNWAVKASTLYKMTTEGVALGGQFCLDRYRPVVIQAYQFIWPGIVMLPSLILLYWRFDFYHSLSVFVSLSCYDISFCVSVYDFYQCKVSTVCLVRAYDNI